MPAPERIVGVIPARLGSKRVKAKNLRLLQGKPMIYYCIRTVLESRCFTERYVNSRASAHEDQEKERERVASRKRGLDGLALLGFLLRIHRDANSRDPFQLQRPRLSKIGWWAGNALEALRASIPPE